MGRFLITLLANIFCFVVFSQEKKTFIVEPGNKIVETIPANAIYRYPSFMPGTVALKDGSSAKVEVNYNRLFGEIQFIDPRGDTISLADEKNIRFVAVRSDTFFFDDGWVELVADYKSLKLGKREAIELANKEKIGALATSGSGSISTFTSIATSQYMKDLVARERLTFVEHYSYFFGDRFNHFSKASKKNSARFSTEHETEIQQWLKQNLIDFADENDLRKFLSFLDGL